MARILPTIVIVPGAWHSPFHYQDLANSLEEAGYTTICSSLPRLDPSNPDEVSVTDDATFIKDKLLAPPLNKGKEVVLVAHSYGGSPASVAANGLSIAERKAKREEGGVIGLVYIAALLVPEGVSLKSAVGGSFHSWANIDVSKSCDF
jgi:pimeloyl-ACP methyl ester carboxylesterase